MTCQEVPLLPPSHVRSRNEINQISNLEGHFILVGSIANPFSLRHCQQTSLVATDSRVVGSCGLLTSPACHRHDADPHREQGVPSNAWQNFGGGSLLPRGNHNLIGSCFNKLSLKWWREESCVNLLNHKPSPQCDAKIQTDTNLQPYCQLWFWHQHFELPTENCIWHLIPIMQSFIESAVSLPLFGRRGDNMLVSSGNFSFPGTRWGWRGERRKNQTSNNVPIEEVL